MGNTFLKLAIMQPTFNPWLGYFDLIDYVDTFVFLDNVQLARRSWQVRNKLKVNQKEYLFTVPVEKSTNRDELLIKDAKISYKQYDFRDKLLNLIIQNYKKASFYDELIDNIKEIIRYKTDFISEYNSNFIISISKILKLNTRFLYASEIEKLEGNKEELIFNIANLFQCSSYVSPLGSKDYLEKARDKFNKHSIQIEYQYYKPIKYKQIGTNFLPYMGVLDLLFNEGESSSKSIILEGRCFDF
jgi:hypothetical protein